MALHLIPDDGSEHRPSRECPCRPDLVEVTDADWVRQAWQHRPADAAVDAVGVEVAT